MGVSERFVSRKQPLTGIETFQIVGSAAMTVSITTLPIADAMTVIEQRPYIDRYISNDVLPKSRSAYTPPPGCSLQDSPGLSAKLKNSAKRLAGSLSVQLEVGYGGFRSGWR